MWDTSSGIIQQLNWDFVYVIFGLICFETSSQTIVLFHRSFFVVVENFRASMCFVRVNEEHRELFVVVLQREYWPFNGIILIILLYKAEKRNMPWRGYLLLFTHRLHATSVQMYWVRVSEPKKERTNVILHLFVFYNRRDSIVIMSKHQKSDRTLSVIPFVTVCCWKSNGLKRIEVHSP